MLFLLLISSLLYSNYFPFIRNDKMGYVDINGEVVIEPIYDTKVNYFLSRRSDQEFELGMKFPDYCYFKDGVAGVEREKWLWVLFPYKREFGLLDTSGNALILKKVKNLYPSSNNFIRYDFEDSKMPSDVPHNSNLISLSVIKRNYKFAEFSESESIDFKNHLEHLKYIYIGECIDNRVLVYEYLSNGVYDVYFIDSIGNKVIQLQDIVYAGDFSNSLALMKTNEDVYFIDSNGTKQFLDLGKIEDATSFNNNRAFIKRNGMFELIDNNGKIITEKKFEYAYPFKNNHAKVKLSSKFYLVDINGEIVLDDKYRKFGNAYQDVIPVEVGSKWRIYNFKEKKLHFDEYDYISQFINGLALAWKEKQIYYINVKGEQIFNVIDERTYEKKYASLMDRY